MTDPNPNINRIPNCKLSLLEIAENGRPYGTGGPSEWRVDTGFTLLNKPNLESSGLVKNKNGTDIM